MIWILVALVAIVASCVWLIRPYKYWIDRGVKQGHPVFPLGDNWSTILRKQSPPEMVQMVYNYSPNSRYCGIYQFLEPTLVLRDPNLIKQITVKDFDHFVNHRSILPEDSDPLWNKNLFALNNQKWRDMRATLSPAFTSSKMKFLFSLMSESGQQFAEFFLKQNKKVVTLEMKDVLTRFTNDVIANTVFGVKCDSLAERDNEFYANGKEATDFGSFWKIAKLFGYMLVPIIYKCFSITLFPQNIQDFFRRIVKENIDLREKQGIVRPDMMHLLIQARKSGFKKEEAETIQDAGFATVQESDLGQNVNIKQDLSDEDIAAQALVFFFGGFDSVSSLMCFMSHELAINPDIQRKLLDEVDAVVENGNGTLTYEALTGMKYLDMVVSESLRKWPNNPSVDRMCTKPYTIEPQSPDEKPVHLPKNSLVWLPIYALHRDPKYFPNPELFDPERFSDENKHKIKPYTYLPFGAGPRNCIGSRFALLETKVLFFYILSNFEIVPVEKTENTLTLSKKGFTTSSENGFWLGLKRRNQ